MSIQRFAPVLFGLMLSSGLIASSAAAQPPDIAAAAKLDAQVQPFTHVTDEQLSQVSTGLLAIIFLGLPISLAFTVLLYDKREAKRTQMIAWLEQIWKQSPQH